ncbi:hypothetical protein M899_2737 [Bacteriovorax sp. BSW11_IV]|uniref:hypothetical protein n=1 Tax=Bacteriovorax sp. BSW11_IV TaxID=1353529 RepID=UPI000389F139|nr:hypothetical protein [Bacteriovorax sp. BSW11_IV]EQC49955.1 hypothetical protein M899_2737 [Bacteriovorax sp. BSW11_IV]
MKYIALITALFSFNTMAEVVSPLEFKYHAHHTKFSCKSFKAATETADTFKNIEMKFSHLGVNTDMTEAIINLISTDSKNCEYRAHYTIDAVADTLTFVDSQILGDNCSEQGAVLDSVMREGFRYISKYYYYFALKFAADFENSCQASTGNYLVEFELGK